MRRPLIALIAVVVALVVTGSALAGSAAPRITFKPGDPGWYVVSATPAAPVKVTLRYGSDCNWIRAVCKKWILVGVKVLPKESDGRISWLKASFWGKGPNRSGEDVLTVGFYRMAFQVPGVAASRVETAWRLDSGG